MQHSAVFTNVTELFILVPALLGLKGNLEMTLASRLSTQANLGNMDTRREKFKMIGGNMALIQVVDSVVLVSSWKAAFQPSQQIWCRNVQAGLLATALCGAFQLIS